MQGELSGVTILGINETGHEASNTDFCEGRDLPWLQDSPDIGMWDDWAVIYRDIFILDAEGTLVDVYNLTENDLSVDYDDFKALLESYVE